jgi:hypothetical protein
LIKPQYKQKYGEGVIHFSPKDFRMYIIKVQYYTQ